MEQGDCNKREHKLYLEKLNTVNIVNLKLDEYLKTSFEDGGTGHCIGWEYLKNNLTTPLKSILDGFDYWKKKYNSEKVEDILFYYKLKYGEDYKLSEKSLNQLSSFVYVWNQIKRECDKKEQEHNLKIELEKQGFKELDTPKIPKEELMKLSSKEIDKRYEEHYKIFDGLIVECVFDISCIGLMGSFDKKESKIGRFFYSDCHKTLMLIPKRCRTKGYPIKDKCYYKEVL